MKVKRQIASYVIELPRYLEEKEKFLQEHPKATIVEEIKTLSHLLLDPAQLPTGTKKIISISKPTVLIMLTWGIVFDEPEEIIRA